MYNIKKLHEYSSSLSLLYVEDDNDLREDMKELLSPLFKNIELAKDGLDGLEKYNNSNFDLVITDINMPNMNGIEMIQEIRVLNPEQKILSISAQNDGDILINVIKAGVSSFVLKPIVHSELINTLYPVCRDAYAQNMNIELVRALNNEREALKQQNKELRSQANTIDIKHNQLETLLKHKQTKPKEETKTTTNSSADEYFEKDEDEGYENITLLSDHCAELIDMFVEIPEIIGSSDVLSDSDIEVISNYLTKTSTIFMYYSPYVDIVAQSFNDLSNTIVENIEEFKELKKVNSEGLLMFFDAVSSDMERYVDRFSVESLAMKNAHHIHRPTALSIQQIVDLINPEEVDYGEMEMF